MGVPTWFSRDDETGLAYLRFRPPGQSGDEAQSVHVELADGPGLVLDFNSEGQLVGIEFLDQGTSHLVPKDRTEQEPALPDVRAKRSWAAGGCGATCPAAL